jgi:CheY-like chemotaxis protein
LKKFSLTPSLAENGIEALERLAEEPFDLVLMDCQMPLMDGFQATAAIRAHQDPNVASLPVIALTANAMAGDEKFCLEAGMNGYLSKPFSCENLGAELERWLVPQEESDGWIGRDSA